MSILNPIVNSYFDNKIQLNKPKNKKEFVEDVFVTRDILSNGKKQLILLHNSLWKDFEDAYKTKKMIISKLIQINIIFIETKIYNFIEKDFTFRGISKIWLIYDKLSQIFSYVIEIKQGKNTTKNERNNEKIIVKSIIPYVIKNIKCATIINALGKLGFDIRNNINSLDCTIFNWSFSIKSIPIKFPGAFLLNSNKNLTLTRAPPNNRFNIAAPSPNNRFNIAAPSPNNLSKYPEGSYFAS